MSNRGQTQRNNRAALSFLLPNLIGFGLFTLIPIVLSLGMAFTNWSLKPAVHFQFVGIRNFVDILGVRATGTESSGLLTLFLGSAALLLVGCLGCLWAFMTGAIGNRLGGLLLALTSLVFLLSGTAQAAANLLAGFGLVVGLLCCLREGRWRFGIGTVPAVVVSIGTLVYAFIATRFGDNYAPRDTYFWQYFYNTVYLMLGIPVAIAGSLGLAMLLHTELPTGPTRHRIVGTVCLLLIGLISGSLSAQFFGPNVGLVFGLIWFVAALGTAFGVVAYRTLFYLPTFTAGVALMILWQALYNPKTGPINTALGSVFDVFGIQSELPHWLTDVTWAKPALIFMGVWTGVGGTNMLLYLAALTNVPPELYEAAELDGANSWQRLKSITWPLLAPTTFFITIMSLIGGLQGGFEQARVLTAGGPAGSTTTLSYYIFNKAFQDLDMGYASAIAWILFAIVFVATALNWKYGNGAEGEAA